MNLDTLFPDVNTVAHNIEPLDDRVLLQIQYQSSHTGLIQLPDDVTESQQFQRTLCKVLSCGDNSFVMKTSRNRWSDIKAGDFVIAPRISGQRIMVNHPSDKNSSVHLLVVEDSCIAVRIQDPEKYLNNLVSRG